MNKLALKLAACMLIAVFLVGCGSNKTDTEVHKSKRDYYNQWLYFTSFENYASVVGVCGSGVLTGKCEESSYTLNKLVKKIKMAWDTVPDHTYYPVFDGKPAEIQKREAKYKLINEDVVDFEYGIVIDALEETGSNVWSAGYCVTLDRSDRRTPKTADIRVEQVSPGCEDPVEVLGWDWLASDKDLKDRNYIELSNDGKTKDGYPIIAYARGKTMYCYFLIDDRTMISVDVNQDENGFRYSEWERFVNKGCAAWLEKLSFERIDFEYDKYTEIVDRDETLESLRGKLNRYPEIEIQY